VGFTIGSIGEAPGKGNACDERSSSNNNNNGDKVAGFTSKQFWEFWQRERIPSSPAWN
jgi:hypothetical protein